MKEPLDTAVVVDAPRAVIFSAGMGTRMVPISYSLPKSLIGLKTGETLIERLILQLREANVEDITVVVGYLRHEFDYLKDSYGVNLVYNAQYSTKDSFASFELVSDKINNCFVVAGDMYFKDNVFLEATTNTWVAALKNSEAQKGFDIVECAYFAPQDQVLLKSRLQEISKKPTRTLKDFLASLPCNRNFLEKKATINFNSLHDLVRHNSIIAVEPNVCVEAIKKVFKCNVEDIKDLEQMGRGMTNTSFLFTIADTRYVFRLPGSGTDQLINRAQEAAVYQKIKPLAISDNVIFIDPNEGYKISEYIHNARQLESEEIKDAMHLLKALHHQHIQVDHHFDLKERIEFYRSICEQEKTTYFEGFEDVSQTMNDLLSWIAHLERDNVLCHIDPVFDNFIVSEDNKIHLLDWEYAGMQDPILDVAMFAIYSNYDEEQAIALLSDYLEKEPTTIETMLLFAFMALSGYLWSLWTLFKEARGDDFGSYGQHQFNYGVDFGDRVKAYLDDHYEK